MLAIMLDPKFKKCAFSHIICKLWKCIKFGCWLLLTIVIAFVIGKVFQITYANYIKWISRIYFTSLKTKFKYIEKPCIKRVQQISPQSHWCGLQVCFELVVHTITKKIPFTKLVKHIMDIPTSQSKINYFFPIVGIFSSPY